ncbi:MAG: ABC transporter substrate-binding protein [Phycisphaerales bacterium]
MVRYKYLRRVIRFLTSALLLLLGPLACSSSPQVCTVVTDLTGTQADFGSAVQSGAKVAMTAAPGPSPIAARFRDAGSDSTLAHALAQSVAPNSLVGIGFTDSDEALAAVPDFVREGRPFVIAGATDPELPARCGPGVFMACFGDDAQADAAAQFALGTFGKRCVVISDSAYDYTRKLSGFFAASMRRRGGSIALEIDRRDPTAQARIASLSGSATQIDFVFVSAKPDGLSELLGTIRRALPATPIIGGDGLDCEAVLRSGTSATDRVFFTCHAWLGEGASPEARAFVEAYRRMHGRAPANSFAALGHDAMMIVQAAAARAATRSPDAIRDEIARTRDFQGASGTISFDAGPVPRKDVWIVEVRGGARRLAERIRASEIVTR